ncbi:MAG TPA: hypothetical protein VE826_03440 [Dongiaceae bacterium]|nr:hypothetical protein [Dongiaceae bacterium]
MTRLGLSALILAVVLTVAFHWAYPDVEITAGLELEFVVAAVIVAGAAGAALSAVARRRNPPSPPPGGP